MQNSIKTTETVYGGADALDAVRSRGKGRFASVRAALICLTVFTFICGIVYPLCVTLIGQTVFVYEANGSQIKVVLPDGTEKIYGSELIGQNYEGAEYMFGRINTAAPSNLSPESDEFLELVNARIAERKAKLAAVGYTDSEAVPDELLTVSGSGLDPHISPETAYFQIDAIIAARRAAGWKLLVGADGVAVPVRLDGAVSEENFPLKEGETLTDYTYEYVASVIDKYTDGRFLGIFGQRRVTVLLVNLALDGLI